MSPQKIRLLVEAALVLVGEILRWLGHKRGAKRKERENAQS